jgi:RNA polymerase sigma-70 factor (ECF subfamily)
MSELLDERLVEKLRTAVRGFVGSRVRDSASAEDIAQDVLLKISARLDSLKSTERIEAWTFRIARNSISDYFRAARPLEQFQEEVHSKNLVSASEADNFDEDSRLRGEINAYIRSVIEALPSIHREALLLTEYDGLSQVQLARRLGLSVSAAKSRVKRARAALKEEIERCCRWTTDRYGSVVDVHPRAPGSCSGCQYSQKNPASFAG